MRTAYESPIARPDAWVAVNTQPHREFVALENLARQDFRTYCPMVRRRVSHARRAHDALRPLFPGYLFVHVSPDQRRWRPISSTLGVRRLVAFGDRLSFVEDGFISALKSREIDGVIARPAEPYWVGQHVRMAGGAFDGLIATIIEMDEKDRLIVLMELLSRPVKVKVETSCVVPA